MLIIRPWVLTQLTHKRSQQPKIRQRERWTKGGEGCKKFTNQFQRTNLGQWIQTRKRWDFYIRKWDFWIRNWKGSLPNRPQKWQFEVGSMTAQFFHPMISVLIRICPTFKLYFHVKELLEVIRFTFCQPFLWQI